MFPPKTSLLFPIRALEEPPATGTPHVCSSLPAAVMPLVKVTDGLCPATYKALFFFFFAHLMGIVFLSQL